MVRHHAASSAQSSRRRRPGQAIRSKPSPVTTAGAAWSGTAQQLSPVIPDSAGDDSIFRSADTAGVESQVEQPQTDEDEQGPIDMDDIAQHEDTLLSLSRPHCMFHGIRVQDSTFTATSIFSAASFAALTQQRPYW